MPQDDLHYSPIVNDTRVDFWVVGRSGVKHDDGTISVEHAMVGGGAYEGLPVLVGLVVFMRLRWRPEDLRVSDPLITVTVTDPDEQHEVVAEGEMPAPRTAASASGDGSEEIVPATAPVRIQFAAMKPGEYVLRAWLNGHILLLTHPYNVTVMDVAQRTAAFAE